MDNITKNISLGMTSIVLALVAYGAVDNDQHSLAIVILLIIIALLTHMNDDLQG